MNIHHQSHHFISTIIISESLEMQHVQLSAFSGHFLGAPNQIIKMFKS